MKIQKLDRQISYNIIHIYRQSNSNIIYLYCRRVFLSNAILCLKNTFLCLSFANICKHYQKTENQTADIPVVYMSRFNCDSHGKVWRSV